MAREKETTSVSRQQVLDTEQVQRHLDMLDQRLDNIDSVITAVVERVMKQPVTLNIVCPKCGNNVEIAIIGNEKPTG